MQLWETDTRLMESLRDLPRAIRVSTVSAGLVSSLMGVSGPVILVFQAAKLSGYTPEQTGSWIFAILAGGGVMTLSLALLYRQPATAAFSIAGAALLVQVLPQFGLHQAIGAYFMGAVLILALALTGWFNRLMNALSTEIILAMLAGVFFHFGAAIFPELVKAPLLVAPTLIAYIAASRFKRFAPPLIVALAVAIGQVLLFQPPAGQGIILALTLPGFYRPEFSLDGFLSMTLPLVLLTLSSQNATGIGVLRSLNYRPRISAITFFTGLMSLITAPMAGHGINLASPMTAICGDEHAHADPEMRYGAAVCNGLFFILFGILGMTVFSIMETLPSALIVVIAGLAMLPVILSVIQQAFTSGRRPMGAVIALVIAASNVQWFGVGAAFWALVLATAVSYVLDPAPEPETEPDEPGRGATP